MNCTHITQLLSDSLDGVLLASDRTQVDQHLATCPSCLEDFRALISTREALQGVAVVEDEEARTAPALPATLVARIVAARAAADASASRGRRVG